MSTNLEYREHKRRTQERKVLILLFVFMPLCLKRHAFLFLCLCQAWHFFSVLNGTACCKGRRPKGGKLSATSPVTNVSGNENSGVKAEELDDLESSGAKQRTKKTSVASSVKEDEINQEMWKEIARALDRIFFWFFLALFVVSSIAIYAQAGRL